MDEFIAIIIRDNSQKAVIRKTGNKFFRYCALCKIPEKDGEITNILQVLLGGSSLPYENILLGKKDGTNNIFQCPSCKQEVEISKEFLD